MSYILKALKKAEQDRPAGSSPAEGRAFFQGTPLSISRKRFPLPFPLVASVITIVLVGGLMAWSSFHGKGRASTQIIPGAVGVSPSREIQTARDVPSGADQREVGREISGAPLKAAAGVSGESVTGMPQKSGSPSGQRIYSLQELPAGVRQGVQEVAVSAHFYAADRSARLIAVNNRIYREGETIAPGVSLEQITPEGIVCTHQGYRFMIAVF